MRCLLFVSLLTAGCLCAGSAGAYTVRTASSGKVVRWPDGPIEVVVDPSIAQMGPGALAAVGRAFSSWATVEGAEPPEVVLREGLVDEVGYRQGDGNHSTVRYLPEGYGPAGPALAITELSFDAEGALLDADLVVNGGDFRPFGKVSDPAALFGPVGNDPPHYDFENVLTHEVGHFFGLGEEPDREDATMFPASGLGETKKRDLSGDDQAGLRRLYPPGSRGEQSFTVSCSAAGSGSGSVPGAGGWAVAAAALFAGLAMRRAKGRRWGAK